MTKKDLSRAIEAISDAYLMEAMDGIMNKGAGDPGEVIEMKTGKRIPFRRIVGIAAALCLILSLCLTAYAARSGFGDWFRGVFSGPPAREEVYENISAGQPASSVNEDGEAPASAEAEAAFEGAVDNGTTITPLAAIADNAMCYIRMRIDAPERTQLSIPDPDTEGYLQLGDEGSFTDLLVNKGTGQSEFGETRLVWEDPVPGDNSVEVVLIYAGETGQAQFNDGNERTVNIHNICLQDENHDYSVILEGNWSFELVFPVGEAKALEVDGLEVHCVINGEPAELEGEQMTLTRMSISPLSLEYAYDFRCREDGMIPEPGTCLVVMKDGTEIATQRGDGETGDDWTRQTRSLTTPIDVDEVDYIQFGSQRIQVN